MEPSTVAGKPKSCSALRLRASPSSEVLPLRLGLGQAAALYPSPSPANFSYQLIAILLPRDQASSGSGALRPFAPRAKIIQFSVANKNKDRGPDNKCCFWPLLQSSANKL